MKTLNLFLILLLMCGGIAMAQVIPYGPKTKSTTTNKAYPQPMQVTPKAETSLESNGMAQGFSNTSNTVSITGNSNLTVTLTANAQNLPNNLGGQFTETELGRISSNGGDPNWKCDNVAMHYSATSDNFLNSQYSAISSSIFPGAIYKAIDFLTGNRNEITVNRNPIQIGVDNIWHTTGATYRNVAEPSQTMVNNAMSSIASSTTGSPQDIKYRVYISDSDAEMALNVAAGGSFAGFSVSAAYKKHSNEHIRILTIDATKTYLIASVNLPANGYFADKSFEQNNANLVVIKNVVYGCRVLANVIITVTNDQESVDFLAKYDGVGVDANGVFNYLKTHSNFESTVNAMVIGGPEGTTTFSAANLENEINVLVAKADYTSSRPISYTLSDLKGNTLGIHSATDDIIVPDCKFTPSKTVYKLKSARIEVQTGGNDPKNDGSEADFVLYNSSNIQAALDNSVNNIEFPANSTKNISLIATSTDPNVVGLDIFSIGQAHIFFTPVQIGFGWDEWQIRSIVLYLNFVDQKGVPFSNGEISLRYDNLNVYLKKDRQRLIIPFTFNGTSFVAGGPYQPSGTSTGISDTMMKLIKKN